MKDVLIGRGVVILSLVLTLLYPRTLPPSLHVINHLKIPLSIKEIPQIWDLGQIRGMQPGDLDNFPPTRYHTMDSV